MNLEIFAILVLTICWNGGVGAATVRVSGDLELKPGQPASLECYGSEHSLSFYITHRPAWSFVNKENMVINITEGFYCVDGATCRNNRYSINSTGVGTEYLFNLTVTAVSHDDDGYYTCSLIEINGNVTDSEVLKLTVLHQVQTLTLEITDVVGATSSTPLTEGAPSIRVSPGPHQVRCTASGSNPSPNMELKYNEDMPNVTNLITSDRDPSGDRVKYTASFTKEVIFSASAAPDQTLTCAANVPQLPTKTAGIKLTVVVVGAITGITQSAGSNVAVTTALDGTADKKATTLTLAEDFAAEITITTLTIVGRTTAPLTWAITTTNNVGLLTVQTGQVALAADKAFDFETSAVVTSVITAVDAAAYSLTATVTLTLSVTHVVDAAPVFNPDNYPVTIAKGSIAGKELVTVTATDDAGDAIVYTISTGNTNYDWAIGGSTGKIVVATGKTIEEVSYTLVVIATSGTPAKTDSATVAVTVNSGAVFGVSLMALFGIILMQLV